MLIASRKVDRLNVTAKQMRKLLSEQSPAELHTVQCNIREEDEVTFLINSQPVLLKLNSSVRQSFRKQISVAVCRLRDSIPSFKAKGCRTKLFSPAE